MKLFKDPYSAGTLDLEQINCQLFPFLKLEFLPQIEHTHLDGNIGVFEDEEARQDAEPAPASSSLEVPDGGEKPRSPVYYTSKIFEKFHFRAIRIYILLRRVFSSSKPSYPYGKIRPLQPAQASEMFRCTESSRHCCKPCWDTVLWDQIDHPYRFSISLEILALFMNFWFLGVVLSLVVSLSSFRILSARSIRRSFYHQRSLTRTRGQPQHPITSANSVGTSQVAHNGGRRLPLGLKSL